MHCIAYTASHRRPPCLLHGPRQRRARTHRAQRRVRNRKAQRRAALALAANHEHARVLFRAGHDTNVYSAGSSALRTARPHCNARPLSCSRLRLCHLRRLLPEPSSMSLSMPCSRTASGLEDGAARSALHVHTAARPHCSTATLQRGHTTARPHCSARPLLRSRLRRLLSERLAREHEVERREDARLAAVHEAVCALLEEP